MSENVTVLRGQPVVNEDGAAGAAVLPGHAVTGVATIVHGAAKLATFALERDEMGQGVLDGYASGDVVKVGTFQPGQRVLAWMASGASAITVDDQVMAQADGTVLTWGAGSGEVALGRALETVDPTAGKASIRIEIGTGDSIL